MRTRRLIDVLTEEFRFNVERYNLLTTESKEVADQHVEMGCAGNPYAAELAKSAAELSHTICLNEIAEAERCERSGSAVVERRV